jgi:hypothetical protein
MTPLGWSPADQAELDVLLDAFVGAVLVHRDRCAVCSAGGPWCEPLRDRFEGILDWRRTRALRSRAVWLRAERIALEERRLREARIEGERAA